MNRVVQHLQTITYIRLYQTMTTHFIFLFLILEFSERKLFHINPLDHSYTHTDKYFLVQNERYL